MVRFGGEIFYDVLNNHFVTKIESVFYDVSGVVEGNFVSWREYQMTDPFHAQGIMNDCILKNAPK